VNPVWVAPQVDHGQHDNLLSNARIENPVWEDTAQEPVVVLIDHAMYASTQAQPLDVGAQASHEVVAQARLLGLVKQEAFIEVVQGIIGNPQVNHARPMEVLMASQSRSVAVPFLTRARRSSSSARWAAGIGIR
jgi:hypothetical protein